MSNDPVEIFRQEAGELLEQLEQGLMDLGNDPDNGDLVNHVFRALHTIKGSGAMFGFTDVADFVHLFETAFDRVRKGLAPVTVGLVAVGLRAKDHIAGLIEAPDKFRGQGAFLLAELQSVVGEGGHAAPKPRPQAVAEPAPVPQAASTIWNIRFWLPADSLLHGTNPALLIAEIAALGPAEIRALGERVPDLETIDPEKSYLGWDIRLTHPDPREALESVFMFLMDGMEFSCTTATAAPQPVAQPQPAAAPRFEAPAPPRPAAASSEDESREKPILAEAPAADRGPSSLRVPAERLDELMDRVGELVIAQARLTQLAAQSADGNLKSVAEELERLSSGLRDTTMGIRMVPIGSLMSRFRRLVHDLSASLGKNIEFVTTGEETELDKTMIERLADPLVHLIRNAVDHGLEPPEDRLKAGKDAKGTVRLAAVYAGTEVSISVSDDGAGLNATRIRQKAEEQGLITPEARLGEQELFQLIFAPGFSTASEVTALSGRGVGMDVVKKTIESLRGKIELTSTRGQGTTATLRLPLTLAIIEGMLVRVGKGRYVIPLASVEECVELPASTMTASHGRNFLDMRGSLVPFIGLREVFNTQDAPEDHPKVVIVSSRDGRVGLVVDQIIGNAQTVIKQLSKMHSSITSFSGATILGDGTVALILDTARLVEGVEPATQQRGKAA